MFKSVFLVGGFAASDWLFTKLKDSLEPFGLTFCRPDSHVYVCTAVLIVDSLTDGIR